MFQAHSPSGPAPPVTFVPVGLGSWAAGSRSATLEPVCVPVLEALRGSFQEPHSSKVCPFLTMAPLPGLKKF